MHPRYVPLVMFFTIDAGDAIRIDPDVIAKAIILDREQSVGHVMRHILYLYRDPFFESELGEDSLTVVSVDRRHLRRAIGGESRNLDRVSRII